MCAGAGADISAGRDTHETWQRAVNDYINALPADKQQAARAPATVDECIQILITQSSRKRSFTRVLDKFRPIIDPLRRFEGTIDVLVQTSTGIASPIWGPIRMAVTVASQHFSTLERLAFVLEKITGCIQRYRDLEELFNSHQAVQRAIGALYTDLIRLCTHVVKFYSSRIRYLVVPFEREFGSIEQSIDLHSAEADHAAISAHMKEAREARDLLLQESQAQSMRRLRCWLSPSVMDDILEQHWKEYFPGSLDWILRSLEFQQWESSLSGQTLEIFGPPGSGKNVLSAFLVHHLRREWPDSPVLYYFCEGLEDSPNSSIRIARTLLAQLLQSDPTVAASILPFYQQNYSEVVDFPLVEQVLLRALQNRDLNSGGVFVILDAIDVLRLDGWLLKSLNGLVGIHCIVTQREPSSEESNSTIRKVSINLDHSTQFIGPYLEQRIQGVSHLSGSRLGRKIIHAITERSNGLWLYARLMIDEIIRAPSEDLIERYLSALPKSLSELYTQILCSREALMTEDEKQFAAALFLWIDVGSILPTFLASRYEPLVSSVLQLIFRRVNGGNDVFDAVALAQRLGAPLLQIRQTDTSHEVGFTHQSAYEYIRGIHMDKNLDGLPTILHPQRLSNLHRGVTAVWYFTACEDSAQALQALRDASSTSRWLFTSDSYFEMDYALWAVLRWSLKGYPRSASEDLLREAEPMFQEIAEFLGSSRCLRWVEMATIINYSGNFQQLLGNIYQVLYPANPRSFSASPQEVPSRLRETCISFLTTWAYVIEQTTGWSDHGDRSILSKPPGFDDSELAAQILLIGQKWSVTCHEELRGQFESRLISDQWTDCPYCHDLLPRSANKKSHLFRYCKGRAGRKRKPRQPVFDS